MTLERRRRHRILLVGTFLLFFLPIVGAWLLNVFVPGWLPFGSTNHGTLVQPVRPLTPARLHRVDGAALDPGYLSGRWTLVHVPAGVCGGTCIDALERTRQVRQALGDDLHRVQQLLVLARSGDTPVGDLPPGATMAVAGTDWLAHFAFADASPWPSPGIYLVDPQGYLMMRYPREVDQRGLLSDLERLLKISKIG